MAAVQAHRTTDHMKEAMAKGGEDLVEPPQVTVISPYAGFNREN
jgi:quinol monooxygenase YgiN